jgi:predicted DNA-binding WGR domain protein
MTKKNKFHKIVDKVTRGYEHKHPLIFFAVLFNVFVFATLFTIHFMNIELDIANARRILFNQPNPTILSDVNEMLEGYPMQEVAPYIATQNREVAAFLVAIAKKESGWGKHTPKLNGQECYNYWGYRGKREKMGSGGHTCFDSPEDAVNTVSRRIKSLIKKGYDTPEKIVVWKCGYSCAGHSSASVNKWIQDVDLYYQQMTK